MGEKMGTNGTGRYPGTFFGILDDDFNYQLLGHFN